MTVLIDLTSLFDNFSGIELYAMSVAKKLIRNQRDSFILVFKNEIHKEFQENLPNVEKVIVKGNNKLFFNQLFLPLKLYGIRADWYLFLAYTQPFFFFSKNVINTIHDVSCWDCAESNKKHMLLYWKLMFRRVASGKGKILTVSNFSRNRIIDILGVKKERIFVTYSAPLEATLNCQYNEDTNIMARKEYNLPHKYLLCLSTLEPRKNLKLLVKAYSRLIEKYGTDTDLVLAGRKGWMIDDLLDQYSDLVKSRIHFTGFIKDDYLPYVYRNAEAFVFPSKYEGFGVPPLEAISQGTLVVASDAASIPEVLEDSAIFFKNDDCGSLVEKMLYALSLSKEQKEIMNNHGKALLKKYRWEEVATRVYSVLMEE